MKTQLPKVWHLVLYTCAMRAAAIPVALPDSSDFTWIPGSNAPGIGNSATSATIVQKLVAAITSPPVGNTDLTGWFGGTGQGHSSSDYGADISIISPHSFSFLSRPRLSGEYVALGAKLTESARLITLKFSYAGTIPAGQTTATGTIGYSLWSYDTTTQTATELVAYNTITAGSSVTLNHLGNVTGKSELLVIWNSNPPGGGGSGIVSSITLACIPYASYVKTRVNPTTPNGRAGVALLQHALETQNQQVTAPGSALAWVLNTVDAGKLTDAGAAAVAGAATAALGMAAQADLNRQLQSIRNRTTTMGEDQNLVEDDQFHFNVWFNAEGNFAEQNPHQTESGYRLSSWGGTLGCDSALTPDIVVGASLTAMYGNLSIPGNYKANGELNTSYSGLFARYTPGAWVHTFIATLGLSDITLKRTLPNTRTEGDTNGTSFGLMYETGRLFTLNEDATVSLQPLFNISWRHSHINGYHEKGSDLALHVQHQTLDTITLGLGARLQAVVGENLYNRPCLLEARIMGRFDAGDRRNSLHVGLAGLDAEIISAEAGAYGLEAGAALIIPLGEDAGNLFMDAAVELRTDYTQVYGTLGYRLNF